MQMKDKSLLFLISYQSFSFDFFERISTLSRIFFIFLPMSALHSRKRFLVAVPLGIVFGFLCSYLASGGVSGDFWWTPLMWTIVTDRMVLGMMVWLAGAYVRHPIFGFRIHPLFRGGCVGIFASLPLATGGMIAPGEYGAWEIFFLTCFAGMLYGMIIDMIATKVGGQWVDIVK